MSTIVDHPWSDELRRISRHLEDAFNDLEGIRWGLNQRNESEVELSADDDRRLDAETVGRLFLAPD
jgi:hypothetical protein